MPGTIHFTLRSSGAPENCLNRNVYKHFTASEVKEYEALRDYRIRRPCADSSISFSIRLSRVASCFALTTHQFMTLR